MHKAKLFIPSFAHKLFEGIFGSNDSPLTDADKAFNSWMKEQKIFIQSNQDIAEDLKNGTPLSLENSQKFKDYRMNSKKCRDASLLINKQGQNSECLRKLSDDQQQKIVEIQLQKMDYTNIFNASNKVINVTNKRIVDAIKKQKTLGNDVAECYKSAL